MVIQKLEKKISNTIRSKKITRLRRTITVHLVVLFTPLATKERKKKQTLATSNEEDRRPKDHGVPQTFFLFSSFLMTSAVCGST